MKVTKYSALLALLMTTGLVHAQTIVPAPGVIVQGSAVVQGPALVNGTLTVQPALATSTTTNTAPGAGVPTEIGGIVNNGSGPVITNQTILSVDTKTQEATGGGGATVQTNGDTTLSANSTTTTTATYQRVVRFDVAQVGNTSGTPVGQPVPGTTRYLLVNPTTGAVVTVPGGPFTTELALNTAINPLTPAQLFTAGTDGTAPPAVPGTGGSLVVEGNSTLGNSATDTTTVNGALVANNGLNATNDKITNLAIGTVATDAANLGQVNAADNVVRGEFAAADTVIRTDFAAADNVVRTQFAAADTAIRGEFAAADTVIRTDFAAADNVVRTQFAAADTAIRTDFATADTALGGRIDSEISARIAGDNTVRTEFAAADTLIRTQFAAADTALGTAVRNEFAAADTTERNARIAGDDRLQSNIDENTRGIAMVAAMTNTTVDIGKTHGVDFNMAQFQSETGFAFGYANRLNENVQVHTSVASTTDFDESVVRLGVAVQW
jgi:hypothetical protein